MSALEIAWRFLVIALFGITAGAGVGILLGGGGSDGFETVVKTVTGERRTVIKTKTETVTKTVTEPESTTARAGDSNAGSDDDTDDDNCSDSYEPVCLDPFDGYNDLDCIAAGDQDFKSTGEDPYKLDSDGDGVACPSY